MVPNEFREQLLHFFNEAKDNLIKYELSDPISKIDSIITRLQRRYSFDVLLSSIQDIRDSLIVELDKHKFIYIAFNKSEFLENDKIFGDVVYEAFPSIRDEIKDAGNCLAGELYTSAIFHLMRAVEKVLRILARDLKVPINKTIIEYLEWRTIIKSIGDEVETMASKSPRGPQKSDMLEFYRGALVSVMGFKDAFRNHVSHSRIRYNEQEAKDVMQHVDSFMRRLSSRLKEARTKSIALKI